MKKNIAAVLFVTAGATLGASVFAQSKSFEGFSVALNANSSSVTNELSAGGLSTKIGDTSENFTLQAAYSVPMGGSGVLGLGGTYALSDFNAGSLAGGSFKGKDMYSLYVEPGVLVSNSTLVYAKAAYLNMKGEASGFGATASENLDGLGYGAGVRVAFGKAAFWQLEFTQSDYNSKSIYGVGFKPSSFNRTLGVGYRF